MTPIRIKITSLFYPVPKIEDNEAKGEIKRMSFRGAADRRVGYQVVTTHEGYDWILIHLGRNYWKVTGKYKE